ncbi:MAG: polyphosphate kinase 1 [Ferruginibacter sp.]
MDVQFFNRDLSWISFNERVLEEAGSSAVPLVERIRFLSIFSSNLDEFYRVRMPALMASGLKNNTDEDAYNLAGKAIHAQQVYFGKILGEEILPALLSNNIHVINNESIPEIIQLEIADYFYSSIAAFLQMINLSGKITDFFSENNKLYQAVIMNDIDGNESVVLVIVPSDKLARFFTIIKNGVQYIVFIEDIIKQFLPSIFADQKIKGVYNIKITRDAALDLEDEFAGDLAEKIETKVASRDKGFATRFLYEPGIPLRTLYWLMNALQLFDANMVAGGKHHNLKDLSAIPIRNASFEYPSWPSIQNKFIEGNSIFEAITKRDHIIHTPYQSYNAILRFFNEAAIDANVEEIYVTLYRIAGDSKIANALITAAINGKKVVVFVELKARFDEENNIRWSKKMKAAGVKIIYSIPNLKVHAKVALVKRKQQDRMQYLGLLSTGNLNEGTARFYTDHILLTAHHEILLELEMLFIFLEQKRKPVSNDEIKFNHLLIAQFNLQQTFLSLIDQEIDNARQGLSAGITIKLNNLEEKKLINKLYEASQAGVPVKLIVRSICCLKPGQPGVSETIQVTRIVDRYLEHGRVFIFNNNNNEKIFLGSADWMNRNIYSRIEVCFPVYDETIKGQLKKIIALQLADNVQAVSITPELKNAPIQNDLGLIRSQEKIYQLLSEEVQAH